MLADRRPGSAARPATHSRAAPAGRAAPQGNGAQRRRGPGDRLHGRLLVNPNPVTGTRLGIGYRIWGWLGRALRGSRALVVASLGGVMGCTFKNAPTAPRKPSWRRNLAFISPCQRATGISPLAQPGHGAASAPARAPPAPCSHVHPCERPHC
jgi:hypothetical protein